MCRYLLVVFLSLLLVSCGPTEEDAKKSDYISVQEMKEAKKLGLKNHNEYSAYLEKEEAKNLGFSSVQEMKVLQEKGFHTKEQYEEFLSAKKGGFDNVEDYRLAKQDGFNNLKDWKAFKFQSEMEESFLNTKSSYNSAFSQKNYFVTDSIEKKFQLQLSNIFPLKVKKWRCNIDKIYSEREIYCSSNSVTYHIELNEPSPQLVVNLSAGETLRFSGILTRELSITNAGAIDNPEIKVENSYIGFNGSMPEEKDSRSSSNPESIKNNLFLDQNNQVNSSTQTTLDSNKVKPSFDCNKAKSDSEKLICNDNELAQLDLDLSNTYRNSKKDAIDKKRFASENIFEWKWREENCHDKECLFQWFSKRKDELESFNTRVKLGMPPIGSAPSNN